MNVYCAVRRPPKHRPATVLAGGGLPPLETTLSPSVLLESFHNAHNCKLLLRKHLLMSPLLWERHSKMVLWCPSPADVG